jgi:integrase
MRGLGGTFKRGSIWWVQYFNRGERLRESSRSDNHAVAMALLKKRQGEIGLGRLVGPDAERLTFEDLRKILIADYKANGRKSTDRAESSMAHLAEVFGRDRALNITADRLVSYLAHRQDEGARPATIKLELSALKRAFNLAVRAGRIPARPAFPVMQVRNARSGFFEESEFLAVCEHLDDDVRPLAKFLYLVGWRSSEAKGLEWRQVDLKAGVLRIDDSKSGDPRTLPYRGLCELVELINEQRERADVVQREKGVIVTHVFFWSDGTRILNFRNAWDRACKASGLKKRLVHDFRRTAARNLSRRGVPESVIMALCGWRTRSVFDRYRIVNEADLAEGLAKLAGPGPVVVPDERGRVLRMRTATEQPQSAGNGKGVKKVEGGK